jgi:hypothetical protein
VNSRTTYGFTESDGSRLRHTAASGPCPGSGACELHGGPAESIGARGGRPLPARGLPALPWRAIGPNRRHGGPAEEPAHGKEADRLNGVLWSAAGLQYRRAGHLTRS